MASLDNFSFLDQINVIPDTFNINYSRPPAHSTEFLPKHIEDFNFTFPEINDPSSFCDSIKHSTGDERKIMDFHKGTTTLGFLILSLYYKYI